MTVQELVVEAATVGIAAFVVLTMVVKKELRLVGEVAAMLVGVEVDLEVEFVRGSVIVILLQDLQHMRW